MTYTHGHHESVLRSHTWRTAENSSAYLLPHLRAGFDLLDVGCGPGTITADLALLVAPGQVVGLDAAADVVARAQEHASALGLANLRFEVGDLFALGYPDTSFDVVHLHQVLQHLADPAAALIELRRVLRARRRPGRPRLRLRHVHAGHRRTRCWTAGSSCTSRSPSGTATTPASGHVCRVWLSRPGSTRWSPPARRGPTPTPRRGRGGAACGPTGFATRASREQAVEYGLSDAAELEAIAGAFGRWAAAPDGVFVIPHVEILARG